MPSFFEGLKRMLNGQPVFQPGEDIEGMEDKEERDARVSETGPLSPPPGEAPVQRTEETIIPQATIVKVENRVNGEYLDISLTIQNNSSVNVELEEINILGTEYKLNFLLPPGNMKEFVSVYNGPRLTHRNYTNSELHYQNDAGKNFKANHNVEFRQEADGTYTIERVRFISPVQEF